MEALEIAVKERKIFRMDGRDYALVFPLPVVVALEEKLGRSMKLAVDWFRIETHEVQAVLEAGLSSLHPEEAREIAQKVADALDPEEIGTVIDGLCAAACPKAMAKIEAAMAKARERAAKGLEPLPNGQGADVH